MKSKSSGWIIFLIFFMFFVFMFFIEVSVYSLLPPEQGGMSFLMEFKNIWYRSIWFYGILLLISLFLYLKFLRKGE